MSHVEKQNTLFSSPYGLLFCLVLVSIAAVVRFSHLGDNDFGIDEILHVYVAQELVEGNPPVLPSGYVYDRSVAFSYLVTLAGFIGKFDEFALRIPSAILGVVAVFLVYWLTTRWFSASAGLVAAFLTTFSPIEIAHSREVRMYMLFQCCFLLMLFFFYEGFESSSSAEQKKIKLPQIHQWASIWKIRPLFLVLAGIMFFFSWGVHPLVLPGVSGLLVYILAMGVIALFATNIDGAIRQKYIGSSLSLIVGAITFSFIFPEKLDKFIAVTNQSLAWGQEHAENVSYYRWLLLDEYPIIFGSLTILLLVCFLKNLNLGLFLSLSLLIPLFLHSVIFPQKSYRYILHILPLMYISAGVGFSALFSMLWSEIEKFHNSVHVQKPVWDMFRFVVLSSAIVGMLLNMPWFMRTVKDYANEYQLPHVSDVQHHKWKNAMQYISERQTAGDVIICGYPLLCRYYGATQPLYFMNDAYLSTNLDRDIRDQQNNLIDYTFGAIVLSNLEDLQQIVARHPSGWMITYRWRNDRFWNDPETPAPFLGTFPAEVIDYVQDHFEIKQIPEAPNMALWRWKPGSDLSS